MEGVKMSQKEYLRKYLSEKDDGTSKRKKKKKKQKIGTKTVKIIDDDDVDVRNMRPIGDGEFDIFNTTEDAPRIVGVVDERGRVDFTDERRWKIIADDGDGNVACSARDYRPRDVTSRSRNLSDGDLSPPRPSEPLKKRNSSGKKRRKESSDSDSSDTSHPKKSQQRRNEKNRTYDSPRSKKKLGNIVSTENSPTRKNSESDQSPPRRRKNDDKCVVGRDRMSSKSLPVSGAKSRGSQKRDDDSMSREDFNRPRRWTNDEKIFGIDRVYSKRDADKSRASDSDPSPPRAFDKSRTDGKRDSCTRDDPRRERQKQQRREEKSRGRSMVSRWSDERPQAETTAQHARMKKTLDGKAAGLQDARALRIETEAHKKREAELLKRMSAEASGAGQAAVLRDRRTGRKRDLAAEAVQRREKEKRQEEMDEKYAKWGKGLKQVEDQTEKRRRDLFEMSKPLARYANDPDLDRELREVEREGDTMLNEIKKRRIKKGECPPEQPSYRGSYLPNRFGIKPGHRWDGVDRSTGYEKKWFDARNARTALQEEAYKWSTADM